MPLNCWENQIDKYGPEQNYNLPERLEPRQSKISSWLAKRYPELDDYLCMEILHFEDLGDTRVLFGCEHSSSSAWRVSNLIANYRFHVKTAINKNGDTHLTWTATPGILKRRQSIKPKTATVQLEWRNRYCYCRYTFNVLGIYLIWT